MSQTFLVVIAIAVAAAALRVYLERIKRERRSAKESADLYLSTVEALARAIDARDQPSSSHLQRVQAYAARLAASLGLSEPEIEVIRTAALLHDIGKLAVPEHILSKPGRLTDEEYQRVRIHPQVGADILERVPFHGPVVPTILGHHERWDGFGYPQGLRGEDIPLGARILSVADYFEALTAERSYHSAMQSDEAIELIKAEAGHALDPQIVAAFVQLMPSLVQDDLNRAAEVPKYFANSPLQHRGTLGRLPSVAHNAYEHIAVAHREIGVLYEIAQAMTSGLGVTDTMEILSTKLRKVVPWSGCALFLYNQEAQTLWCGYAAGVDAPRLRNITLNTEAGLCGWVARNRRTLVNANPAVTFLAAGIEATALQSAIVCPLVSNDSLIGVLSLFHLDGDHYTEDHRRLLERVADQAGKALYNATIFERTQKDALTDALTGLPNRRAMANHFARELARAERNRSSLALVVIDVDGFKAINDTYGHTAGDVALRHVAKTLHGHLRPYDLCGRYAGDEFLLILTDCNRESAELRRVEVQQCISELRVEVGKGKSLRIEASAGTAVYPFDGSTYEGLIAEADRHMYLDKTRRAAAGDGGVSRGYARRPVDTPSADPAEEVFASLESGKSTIN